MINPIAKTLGAASTLDVVDAKKELALRREEIKSKKSANVEYAEVNLKLLIEESIEQVPDMMELMKQSQVPRMYEAAASFIKMISDLNKDLVGLSKTTPGEKETPQTATKEVSSNTNIFVGSTEDFLTRLSKQGKTYEGEKV